MKLITELRKLFNKDPNKENLPPVSQVSSHVDPNHVERRKRQRAITQEMISIALMYGLKERSRGAMTYNLSDRALVNTPYKRFLSELRGLTVVVYQAGEVLEVVTAYWNDSIIKRRRY